MAHNELQTGYAEKESLRELAQEEMLAIKGGIASAEAKVLIFDLGGGTFDVSL